MVLAFRGTAHPPPGANCPDSHCPGVPPPPPPPRVPHLRWCAFWHLCLFVRLRVSRRCRSGRRQPHIRGNQRYRRRPTRWHSAALRAQRPRQDWKVRGFLDGHERRAASQRSDHRPARRAASQERKEPWTESRDRRDPGHMRDGHLQGAAGAQRLQRAAQARMLHRHTGRKSGQEHAPLLFRRVTSLFPGRDKPPHH